MPSAGVNWVESQNQNSDGVLVFDVAFPIEQAEEGVFFLWRLSARMFEQIMLFMICEFRTSHKKCN